MNETLALPGFGKRILSHTLDLFVVFLTGLLLYASVTSTFFLKAIGGVDDSERAYRFLGDSGLFSLEEKDGIATAYAAKSYLPDSSAASGSSPAQTDRGYVLYLHDCYNFYVSFLGSDQRVSPVQSGDLLIPANEFYTADYFYTSIMGLPVPAAVTVTSEASRAGTNPYFMYALTEDSSALDLTAEPVLQSEIATKVAVGDAKTLSNLKEYFCLTTDISNSGLFVDAVNRALADPYFTSNAFSSALKVWAAYALAVAPLVILNFLVLPLVDKKGRTLGKMITGLAVVGADEAPLRGWPKVLHPLLMGAEVLVAVIYPLTIGLMAFLLVSLIDYTSAVVSKSHRSFHERIARTKVIDARASARSRVEAPKKPFETPDLLKTKPEEGAIASESNILDLHKIEKARAEANSLNEFDEGEKNQGEAPSNQEAPVMDKPVEAKPEGKPSEPAGDFRDQEKK